MALEAVVYQQELFGHNNGKDLYSLLENWSCDSYAAAHRTELAFEEEDAAEELESGPYDHHLFFETQGESLYAFPNWDASLPLPFTPNTATLLPDWGTNYSSSQESSDHNYTNHLTLPAARNIETNTDIPTIDEDAPALLPFDADPAAAAAAAAAEYSSSASTTRPKRRRRPRSRKNKEDIENQRMTHIAVERNRRRQMNEYLAMLRSLMPDSYVQRGDQASIIGGAINFVKELEQKMQCLTAHKYMDRNYSEAADGSTPNAPPFGEFFTFPQYSLGGDKDQIWAAGEDRTKGSRNNSYQSGSADIEVTMVESHANLKIRSNQRPKQLLKLVSALQCLRLPVLHLNVSTVDQVSLYCISVKVEDDSKLTSVDEIATAVHQLLSRIEQGDSL